MAEAKRGNGRGFMAETAVADRPKICSVLLGCTSANMQRHNLRLHRFRVDAASGRVLGCRNDVLERFVHVSPAAADVDQEIIPDARAALGGDGRRLYLFCDRWCLYPKWSSGQVATSVTKPALVMALNLADRALSTVCVLDDLPCASSPCWPVSAAGEIWGPYLAPAPGSVRGAGARLVMLRLDGSSRGRGNLRPWVDAGHIDLPRDGPSSSARVTGSSIFGGYTAAGKASLLQGYAVIDDVILVSLASCEFFCFHCSTSSWSRVATMIDSSIEYVPINGRAVYVAQHRYIYFFRDSSILGYKFSPEGIITPPIKLCTLSPSDDFGNGFLTNISSQVLCAVWVGMSLPCECTTRHVLVTTLRVIGSQGEGFVPNNVHILHSTCRSVQMMSTQAQDWGFDRFCFLQDFQEQNYDRATLQSLVEDETDFHVVDSLKELLPCCWLQQ